MDPLKRLDSLVKSISAAFRIAISPTQIHVLSKKLAEEGFFVPSTKIGNQVWYLDFPKKPNDILRVVPATVIQYSYHSTAEFTRETVTVYFKGRDDIMTSQEAVFNETVFMTKKEADGKAYFTSSRKRGEDHGKISSL